MLADGGQMPDPKPDRDRPVDKTGWREIGWFVALWVLGVATVTAVGALIKLMIGS